jgi:hypothetical protein
MDTEKLVFVLIVFGLLGIPEIFFLISMQKALERCSTESRTMSPWQVWLWLIPLFSLVWQFIVVVHIASSLRNELLRRQLPLNEAEPGQTLGITQCVLELLCWVPAISWITALPSLICWIVYWVKIAGYSRQLAGPPMLSGTALPSRA